jgi:hypothetical protein
MSDDINKKHIEKQMSLLEKIYFDDSDKYTNKERAEAAQKHQTLGELIGDNTVLVGPSKKTPMGKPGARRAKKRGTFEMGGLLEDERLKYEHGGPHTDTRTEDEKQMDYLESAYERAIETGQKEDAQNVADQIDKLQTKMIKEAAEESDKLRKAEGGRVQAAEGFPKKGSLLSDDMAMLEEDMPTHTMPDGTVMPGATHGEDEMMMSEEDMMSEENMMPEEDMLPDDEMEDEYLDFILDEALDSEEEDYLMSQLQDNDRLSEIFDKVIDVAQEFAGSGPVEGPGSGVSDSIPARLSDGEFVFTAKAVEEIGADNLMAMMKDAEIKADERQGLAEGGQPEEEETVVMPVEQPASQQDIRVTKTTVGTQASMQEEQDLIGDEVKKSMLRGSRNLG